MNQHRLPITEIWVYLSGSPLFALVITLLAYQTGLYLYQRFNRNPLANPVGIAILIVSLAINAVDMPYAEYFKGAQFVHFLLGTATVSLAVPIYRGIHQIGSRALPLFSALIAGGLTSMISAVGIAKLLGADATIVKSMYAKSITAPIAMGVSETIGASPTLTAVFAVVTGISGAIMARYILDFFKLESWWQRGFVIGIGAHGIGTSRAFSVHPEAGAYSSLAMGLHGVLGAVAIPLVAPLIERMFA
ncbi:MAG: LrgB family protein [Burkholderiaceae bacterium]